MKPTVDITPAMRGLCLSRGIDAAIAALAELQHGVVTRWQLYDLGMSSSAIDRRIEAGRLHVLHPGVYAVGDRALPTHGRLVAAVYAAGTGAVASHRSAAMLHGLRAHDGWPEVTARPGTRKHDGICIHRTELQPDEITIVHRIPVTTVARTLLDLDRTLVDKALRQSEFLRVFDLGEIARLLERYPRRRGTAHLREAVRRFRDSALRTRSDMETAFHALVLDANLPPPEVNGTVALGEITIEADVVWRDAKVIVELDGRQAHLTMYAFETDRERDRAAALAGWVVIRVTWHQLTEHPRRLVRDIRRLLNARHRH
ncbi:MAG TPA: type IV toxin-antitoxin system AbiEi family antitoxin domain-containing protein [Thermoleophilaceae bacterium]|jgi:very-short-patch-repair endonuclease|nr:type IV toxin-antitoxin system AbiEi family antitoxin domain-containing protein [Thermoleophilaceae bacterium]